MKTRGARLENVMGLEVCAIHAEGSRRLWRGAGGELTLDNNRLSIGLRMALAILTLFIFVTGPYAAAEVVLHNFNYNGRDGFYPGSTLVADIAGNLYGTTVVGGIYTGVSECGSYGCGTVFELARNPAGGYTEKVVHSFSGTDGCGPTAGLTIDAAGNLYGTTGACGLYEGGTVFELSANAAGGWTRKVLHHFGNNTDGQGSSGALLLDGAGNLFGTTVNGGSNGLGTVFELSPKAGGGWTEKVLHSFNQDGTDGFYPYSGLVLDTTGNLYGTTNEGGMYREGTVFELSPKAGGGWTEKVIHHFGYGSAPYAGLVLDPAGNLYGTTFDGGMYGYGTVFELSPKAGGGWAGKVIHSFHDNGRDGNNPEGSGLVLDAAGNLYGATFLGGRYGFGTVFELSPNAGGGWTEKVLHSFNHDGTDGFCPYASLVFDAAGYLYGTTVDGGIYGYGTVFRILP